MELQEADRRALRDISARCDICRSRLVDTAEQEDGRCIDCTLETVADNGREG